MLVIGEFAPLACPGPLTAGHLADYGGVGRVFISAQQKVAAVVAGDPEGVTTRGGRVKVTTQPGSVVVTERAENRGLR